MNHWTTTFTIFVPYKVLSKKDSGRGNPSLNYSSKDIIELIYLSLTLKTLLTFVNVVLFHFHHDRQFLHKWSASPTQLHFSLNPSASQSDSLNFWLCSHDILQTSYEDRQAYQLESVILIWNGMFCFICKEMYCSQSGKLVLGSQEFEGQTLFLLK